MASARGPWTIRFAFLFLSVVWGFNFLFMRVGLADSTSLWLALLRASVGAGATAAALLALGAWHGLDRRGRRDAFLLGLPNTAAFYGFLFVAIRSVLPGVAAVLVYTFPLWVAILSPSVLGHRLTVLHWVAVLGGFLGVALIAQAWDVFSVGTSPVAILELLGAAIAWAIGTVLFQRRFHRDEMLEANAFQLFGGTTALALLVIALAPRPLPTVTVPFVVTVLWLGVLGTAVAYMIWYWLLGRTRAATLSAYVFLVPVVALTASAVFFGERLAPLQLLGVVLVLVSIYGISRSPVAAAPAASATPAPPE